MNDIHSAPRDAREIRDTVLRAVSMLDCRVTGWVTDAMIAAQSA